MRLGELNLESNPDCDVSPTETICADNFVDVLIEKVIPHENYNNITLENDIALIKLKRKLNFTGKYLLYQRFETSSAKLLCGLP